jgi:leader peptidase (prepilin peptidase) / N-methyltransferase
MSQGMDIVIGLFGACIGSFLNVLADRLPRGQDVIVSRSRCDFCKKTLAWHELIPVVSFFVLRGRCRRCHHQLSWQYPIIELIAAFGFVTLWHVVGATPVVYIASLLIFCSFLVIFVADAKYQIIPDSMVVTSLMGSILWVVSVYGMSALGRHMVVGVICMAMFYALWWGTRGRGMGFGDVKLSGVLGLFLGFPLIVFALYGGFLTGAAAGVILIVGRQKTLKSKIAFGPFLLLGVAIAVVWSNAWVRLWNQLF